MPDWVSIRSPAGEIRYWTLCIFSSALFVWIGCSFSFWCHSIWFFFVSSFFSLSYLFYFSCCSILVVFPVERIILGLFVRAQYPDGFAVRVLYYRSDSGRWLCLVDFWLLNFSVFVCFFYIVYFVNFCLDTVFSWVIPCFKFS